ncbi:MAG: 3-phosphoshikimate 1-carboxyvinyltransferase [Fibrobacter sp.]|nr:3-phosphoshikimate 1-carboxyvinyltransferase [Fibrobacter sp.]
MAEPFSRPSFIQLPALSSYNGEVRVPGSKSITNRVFLISALAEGTTKLHNLLRSDDTLYMGEALKALDIGIEMSEDFTEATIVGNGGAINAPENVDGDCLAELYLGNAGTAMRSLCAALTLGEGEFHLSGEQRMKERPIRDLVEALQSLGADVGYMETEGYPPVCIKAHGLNGGTVSVRGNISSQYLTALLICAPYAKEPLHIHVEGQLISAPYILLTLDVMRHFGIEVRHDGLTDFYVPKGVYKSPGDYMVEGDASSASYPLAAAAIAKGKVRVLGVGSESRQGDVAFVKVLEKMGAKITMGPDWVECEGADLHAVDLNLNDIPDAAMTVAVLALFADGTSHISGIASWRVKETDRIAAIVAELRKMGAQVSSDMDSITVTPPEKLNENVAIETYNDHRMAMCFSLAALGGVPVKIMDPACVGKTYPKYFEDFLRIAK